MTTATMSARDLFTKARDTAAAAEDAGRDLTDDERKSINDLVNQARDARTAEKAERDTRSSLEQLGQDLGSDEAEEINRKALDGARVGAPRARETVGQTFAKSEAFQDLQRRLSGGGSSKASVSMDPVHVAGLKALVTSGASTDSSSQSASGLVQPDRLGLIPTPYVAPRIRDLITNGTTGSDKIEYAQLLPWGHADVENAAKGVKEAPATTGAVGVKPESKWGFRKASADVITIAHWQPVTRRTLSDAAQVRTMIDNFLSTGLEHEIERLIVEGDRDVPKKGEEEWDGVFNTTGVQDQAWDTDLYVTSRRAISRIQKSFGDVTGFMISPETEEELDLMRDDVKRFYGGGPFAQGPRTLWGRPTITVPALSGTKKALGGDLSQMVLWDREQASLYATDSHADFFVRNLVAVLAECRAAFGILNPGLLVAIDAEAPAGP